MHDERRDAACPSLLFTRPVGLLHDTVPTLSKYKPGGENLVLRGLIVSLVLWNIGLQERQERIGIGHSRGGLSGICINGGGGRSVDGFRRIALGEFRNEICREGGNGEPFYGTDVVIGSLRKRDKLANKF